MAQLTNAKAYAMMGKKVVYVVDRIGLRSTYYYYDNLKEAVEKYDEVCMRKNYMWVDLRKYPVKGKYVTETVYTTNTSTVGVKYRNISKRK